MYQRRANCKAEVLFKPLLASCLLMPLWPEQLTSPVQRSCRKAHFLRADRSWGVTCGCFCIYPKLLSQFGLFLGESNININRDLYNCTFPALIEDWRQTFHRGSQGQTERFFPFGFVQVCVERKRVFGHWGADVLSRSLSWNPCSFLCPRSLLVKTWM